MWKKRLSTYAILASVVASVVIGLLPRLPKAAEILGLRTTDGLIDSIFLVVGIAFALLTATISTLLLEQRHELVGQVSTLVASLHGPRVRKLRDQDFYSEFLHAAERASSSVCISYFGPQAPDAIPDPTRKDYYRRMHRLMRKRGGDIRFRRLVRQSADNERWIARVARELIGRARVDLALITDLDSTNPANTMPLALSIQIVDQNQAWIVAVQSHEQIGDYRDVAIEGGDLPKMLQLYFDRLWKHAQLVLVSGSLTAFGQELVDRFPKVSTPDGSLGS